MSATLGSPSVQGYSSTILTRGHFEGGNRYSFMITRLPILRRGPSFCHFCVCSSHTYSFLHLYQKWALIFWMCSHLRSRDTGFPWRFCSGIAVQVIPIKKWAGVKVCRSDGSWDNGVKGRELRIASTCTSTLYNSSYVNGLSKTLCFTELNSSFPQPTKIGASWRNKIPLDNFVCSFCN